MRDQASQPQLTARQVWRLVATYGGNYVTRRLAGGVFLLLIASALTPLGPVALKLVVDAFTGRSIAPITVAVAVALYVTSQFLSRLLNEFSLLSYYQGERRIIVSACQKFFAHILRLPFKFHSQNHSGGVTQIRENGLQGIQIVLQHIFLFVLPCSTQILATTWILFRTHQYIFLLIFCIAVMCYGASIGFFAARLLVTSGSALNAQVEAGAIMSDCTSNFEPVKFFGAESYVENRVHFGLLVTERRWNTIYRTYAMSGVVVSVLSAIFISLSMMIGIRAVSAGTMSVGEFVLVNTYMLQLLAPVELMGYAAQQISRGWAMIAAFVEVLEERTEAEVAHQPSAELTPQRMQIVDEISTLTPADKSGAKSLAFCNVSVYYDSDRRALHDVSFFIPAGNTLGIVGASGSGKTTLVRLIMRLVDPDRGTIWIDGTPSAQLSLEAIRHAVAVVPQDTILFNESIRYNIAFGKADCSNEEVEHAARLAQLHDFICSLPSGYDTPVGERGVKLSGGEKQRISIARAVLKSPSVYLFDEATSSLDSSTEKEIMNAVREISRSATSIIIAHRLSTVVYADEIIVLDKGVVSERGTHQALLHSSGRYSALWSAQSHQSTNSSLS